MKFKFNQIWDSKWFYCLLALILAVALFAYVNMEDLNRNRNSGSNDTAITATTSRSLKVPLELKADTDKYFITGYPQHVTVEVEGSSSLVTVTANTLNFRVVADLSGLGVGTHTVTLKQQGLNKDLTYAIKPKTIKVTIQDRKSKRMPIQVKYNHDSLAPGYSAGDPTLSSETVDVTGGKGEINRVYQVVANVVMSRNTKTTIDQEVLLQALAEDGSTLNVVLSPATVHVRLPITLPSKKLPVTVKQSGTGIRGQSYSFKTSTDSVTVYGSSAVLKKLDSVTIPVDVSKLTQTTTQTVRLTDVVDGIVSSDPKTVKVTINMTTDAAAAAGETSSSAETSSSSSGSSND
ncbi:MAG: CdaR family protein [Lactobacillus sp.]|jgi:YbbR domain-containing protein|uniref:YbbR-like domain-containing protein n=1 Tax=Lacticaseibacillus suilingensis TaxID=2799577 RepID=A0ABW4BGJ8_9LACO|nr:CdaR family protein [Lacticaseibacillus suilingensis]MCI1894133.1 CdaR family protein [Lactobacillus sp.]MCI1917966.1 CdaR family protein [Lactobacillus sp.]MCI1941449.1 CdaR family protein [Lactobacillus sp.]MCI1972040.1 CdaR family protein [Lactobacillus sp.]MCI2016117.1 CdaR family protein [Lactobacillus sp.]